ncbi:MAG: VOC family protein [Dehalococcoidia bacterium]|nr:VOC family protein [Dehalococcoidia bacterium]
MKKAEPVKPQGVNRVVIAVWDMEKSKKLYSDLLGATFHDSVAEEAAELGLSVSISWDAGIELVSPLPDCDSKVKRTLEKRGEGLIGAVWVVDDIEKARATAEGLGIPIWYTVDYSQDQINKYQQGRFSKFKEYMLDPRTTYGVETIIGQIEPKS